jgi:hypothetical protein
MLTAQRWPLLIALVFLFFFAVTAAVGVQVVFTIQFAAIVLVVLLGSRLLGELLA